MIEAADTNDFGHYLSCVAERDIDLLLMEEFHVSDDFVAWFAEAVGEGGALPSGAWHSVSDTDGETDLLLRVHCGHERVGILIENKVGAPEQDAQGERYHLRGIRSREAGKFDRFVTVMCAPEKYLEGLPADTAYQFCVSYEAIAEWFERFQDRRSAWRAVIMKEAIAQNRRRSTMAVDEGASRFHSDFYDYLARNHPSLRMSKPTKKSLNSTWIVMKGANFPKNVWLNFKLGKRTLDLSVGPMNVADLYRHGPFPDDIVPEQLGESAALVVRTPLVELSRSVAEQVDAIEAVLKQAERLAEFAPAIVA